MTKHSRTTYQTHPPAARSVAITLAVRFRNRWRRRVSWPLIALIALAALSSACVAQTDGDQDVNIEPDQTDATIDLGGTEDGTDAGAANPNLAFEATPSDVICDGTRREIGQLGNADAYEPIDFDARDTPFVLVGEARGDGTLPIYWKCLPSEGNRKWTITASGMDSGRSTTFTVTGRLPPPARPGGIEVEVVERPFSCDGEERVLAKLANLTPNVEMNFDITPEAKPVLRNQADEDGNLTLVWRCMPEDVPTAWMLVASESTPEPQRRASFRFNATNEPYRPEAAIEIFEDPFICDDVSRQFAVLSRFQPFEFVRFSSPQTGSIKGGQADENGRLQIRWVCDPGQAGMEWEVTASGDSTLATVTFTIVGGEPG